MAAWSLIVLRCWEGNIAVLSKLRGPEISRRRTLCMMAWRIHTELFLLLRVVMTTRTSSKETVPSRKSSKWSTKFSSLWLSKQAMPTSFLTTKSLLLMWINGTELQRLRHLGERRLVRTTSGIGKKDITWWSRSSDRLLSLSTPFPLPPALFEPQGMDVGAGISSSRTAAWIHKGLNNQNHWYTHFEKSYIHTKAWNDFNHEAAVLAVTQCNIM